MDGFSSSYSLPLLAPTVKRASKKSRFAVSDSVDPCAVKASAADISALRSPVCLLFVEVGKVGGFPFDGVFCFQLLLVGF